MNVVRKIEIEDFIRECFDRNHSFMSHETGRKLNLKHQEIALQQVLYYLYRMWDIAEKVTEAEVRLVLPGQRTRKNRKYNLLGIVDIASDSSGTKIYDLKTLEKDVVLENKDRFRKQLSIYSHIWREIRGQCSDRTAIIVTSIPNEIKKTVKEFIKDPEVKFKEFIAKLNKVDPVISVETDENQIQNFLAEFGDVIDKIEEKIFTPASVEKLRARQPGKNRSFGSLVCRKCDARYSCSSYREYVDSSQQKASTLFSQYWGDEDETSENWIVDNLNED